MNYEKTYERIQWVNESDGKTTALGATNMNKMDKAINVLDDRVIELKAVKAEQSDLLMSVKSITYDETTGVFIFTWHNGSSLTIDLNVEKIPASFSMSEAGVITMTNTDGTKYTCNVADLIKAYLFKDSAQIAFTLVTNNDGNYEVTAKIVGGSITADLLDPEILATIEAHSTNAGASASSAASSATSASESAASAKEDAERAELAAKNAELISGVGIATETVPGLMAGGDNAVEDGVLTLTKITTDRTLLKSKAGGLKVNSIEGDSRQETYSGYNLFNPILTQDENYTDHYILELDGNGTGTYMQSANMDLDTGTTTWTGTHIYYIQCSPSTTYTIQGLSGIESTVTTSSEKPYYHVAVDPVPFMYTTKSSNDDSITVTTRSDDSWLAFTLDTENITSYLNSIQIVVGSEKPYEKYVGCTASPNPDYPQSIDSVVVREIKSVGKNLQYNSATYKGWSAVSTTLENVITNETYNGGKVLKCTKPWQYIQPPVRLYKAGTYTISFDAKLDIDGNGTAYIYGLISKGIVVGGKTFKRYSSTFTITEDKEHRLTILIPANPTYSELYIANIQVEEGSTATPYEPYTEEKITLSNPITLRGIGDVKDVLCKQDGVYGVLSKMYEFTLNGTQTPNTYSGGSFGFNAFDNVIAKVTASSVKGNGLSERFIIANSDKVYAGSVDNSFAIANTEYVRLRLYSSNFTSVNDVTAFFTDNPTKFIVPLATPTFEPLPLADQIALHQLETFDTVTYISTDSEIEPVIEVEYGTSVVGAYALKGMNASEANRLENEQLKATILSLSNALLESESEV